MKIVIPMAGRGSRFEVAGYANPKPLIDVNGKPMIQRVIDNIGLDGEYVFLVLSDHLKRFNLENLLPQFCGKNKCSIVPVDQVTEGAACTVLLARDLIGADEELVLANSDQLVEWEPAQFVADMRAKNADGGILTFTATESKWSFARVVENDVVVEVAEKNPISNHATVGIYYYRCGRFFTEGADQMIQKNIRTNNEFYVCPVYNEIIQSGKIVYNYPITKMYGIGTPEDLEKYLSR